MQENDDLKEGREEEREGQELKLEPEFIAKHVPDMYLDEDGNMRRFKKTQDVSQKGWMMWMYDWTQYAYFLALSPFTSSSKKDDKEENEQEDV